MMDHELAAELHELAADPRLATRQEELRDLALAITDSDEAERWCEVDLFAAFSPEDSIIPSSEPAETKGWWSFRWASIILSSLLIFVPLLITWFGLMMATDAYEDALLANPEAARRPFLEMWQQGFDGHLPDSLKFGNIAFYTLGAIAFLILWTIIENGIRNRVEQREDTSEEDLALLRARLRRALTRTSLLLGQVRLSSPARFGTELTKTVNEINLAGAATHKAQAELVDALSRTWRAAQQTVETLTSGAAEVRTATGTLSEHVKKTGVAHKNMTAAVQQASETIDTLGSTTDQAVTRVGDQLSTTISRTTVDLRREFTEELTRSMKSLQAMLDTRTGELVGATASIGYAVDRAADSIDSVGSSTAKAVDLIGGQVVDSFTGTATGIREALGDWADTAGAHASRIEMVSDTSGRTISLLEQTRATLDRLPAAIAEVLADLPAKVRELSEGEFAGLKDAISELCVSVDQVSDLLTSSASGAMSRGQETLW
ncbi:hypothetical protein ABT061_04195 [Streptosporangium sp. NPDC002544]|uniref:hypothetical protein n=1 Tax=Streptosporangium sp. NPDC002544 TaxID=3154538 RepID=UPI00332E4AE3